jgi:RNA polymerase sigma factor (sigma-70 family)
MTAEATTDAELIEASRRGEAVAFGCLVERHQRMVEAVAYGATRDRTIIEDVVQDTFVVAWHQLARLRDVERLRPWLCGIARNLARKARRNRRRALPVSEPLAPATPFEAATEHERDQLVAGALVEVVEFETTDPALRGEMTITITLADADGGTDLVAVHEGLPPGVALADNELGWQLSLAKLAALVEAG